MPTLAALKAPLWAGATREPAWAGPGATRGVATALEAAPNTRLGRDSRREIAGGPAPSTPSGRLARGITCPPPGVNRDPPAQAPAETIRPGGRPEEPRRSGANQSEAKIIPSRAQQPRLVGISGSGVAARAQRAHTGPEQQTCARALEGDVRGHGYRGAENEHKACEDRGEARLPMAPHLPWAGILTEKGLPPSEKFEPRFCFSKASARAAYQIAAACGDEG